MHSPAYERIPLHYISYLLRALVFHCLRKAPETLSVLCCSYVWSPVEVKPKGKHKDRQRQKMRWGRIIKVCSSHKNGLHIAGHVCMGFHTPTLLSQSLLSSWPMYSQLCLSHSHHWKYFEVSTTFLKALWLACKAYRESEKDEKKMKILLTSQRKQC